MNYSQYLIRMKREKVARNYTPLILKQGDGLTNQNPVKQVNETKVEILQISKDALEEAYQYKDSAMVAAIAETIKAVLKAGSISDSQQTIVIQHSHKKFQELSQRRISRTI
nr:MAG TPA: hypothetical protein [Caudoviricetes sp.]